MGRYILCEIDMLDDKNIKCIFFHKFNGFVGYSNLDHSYLPLDIFFIIITFLNYLLDYFQIYSKYHILLLL
jgi:hypothetical protein